MAANLAVFGPGILFVTAINSTTGTTTGNTPVNVGYAQEFSIDENATLVESYGQNQFPLDIARGTVKATGKIKTARVSGIALNALFHGMSLSGGGIQFQNSEQPSLSAVSTTVATAQGTPGTGVTLTSGTGVVVGETVSGIGVASGTVVSAIAGTALTLSKATTTALAIGVTLSFGVSYVVVNAATFNSDLGVSYVNSNLPLLYSGTSYPSAAGFYGVNPSTGTYYFHPTDVAALATQPLAINYSYTVTTGQTKMVTNQLIGYTPSFQLDYATTFNGKQMYIRIYRAVSNKLSRKFDLKSFSAPEIDIGIMANAAGAVYSEYYPEIS